MDLIQLEFYAHSLGGAARVNVLLPSPSPERLEAQGPAAVYAQEAGRKWPTLLLLHGMQGNESAWLRHSMAEQSAAQAGVAVVMPGLLNSYGFDLGFDLSFEQYLRTELPAFLASRLPLDLSPAQYTVAGLSMGGFAALRLAALDPGCYAAAGSFSGAVEPWGVVQRRGEKAAGAVLAHTDALDGLRGTQPVYLACGQQDALVLDMNRRLHQRLESTGIPHTYEEWSGGHEWTFWDTALRRFLTWRAQHLSPCSERKELQ